MVSQRKSTKKRKGPTLKVVSVLGRKMYFHIILCKATNIKSSASFVLFHTCGISPEAKPTGKITPPHAILDDKNR